MKTKLLVLMIITALISSIAFAETGNVDTPQTRKAAAGRYLKAGTLQAEINGAISAMTQQFGASADLNTLVQSIQKTLDFAQMENVWEEKLIQHFTTDELNAMANFYGSDTGRAIERKMPQFTAETLRAMSPMLQEAFVQAAVTLQKSRQDPEPGIPGLPSGESAAPVKTSPLPY